MTEDTQALHIQLENARQELELTQKRCTELEAQLLATDSGSIITQLITADDISHALDNLLEGYQLIGFDWRYLYINSIAAQHGHLPKDKLLGRTMMECYPGIEETDMFKVLQRCMRERTAERLENLFTYPDGTTAWFELRIEPVPQGISVLSLDISKQKQHQEALRESEHRLRLFIEHAPAAIAMFDLDMKYLVVSQRWAHDYGLSASDVIGKSHYEVFPDIPDKWHEIHQRCLQGATERSEADAFPRADGTVDWVRWEIHPWYTNNKDVGGIILFSEVITERIQSELALKKYARRIEILHEIDLEIINAESIEQIFENSLKNIHQLIPCEQVTVAVFDETTSEILSFTYRDKLSPNIIKDKDYPIRANEVETIGKNTIQVINNWKADEVAINPILQHLINESTQASLQVLLHVKNNPLGLLVLNADTSDYFTSEHREIAQQIANQLAIAIHQINLDKTQTGFIKDLKQTQEQLRLSEAQYRSVVEDQTELICRYDPDLRLTFVNNAYAQNFGMTPNEMIGMSILEKLTPSDREAFLAHLKMLTPSHPVVQSEYPSVMPDNAHRWYHWTDRVLVNEIGEIVEYQAVGWDITQRKEAERAEHQQRILAETLRDSLAMLTASSDMETLMGQILAYSAQVIPSEAGTIILFKGNQGRVAYSRGYSAEAQAFFRSNLIPLDVGIVRAVNDEEGFYFAPDTGLTENWASFIFTDWVRSSIGVAIKLGGEVIGALIADSAIPNRFSQTDLKNLQTFAQYAALALEKVHHVNRLEQHVAERTAELQTEKERVEAILDNSPDGILLLRKDLIIERTNSSFDETIGGEPNNYVGKPLLSLCHPSNADNLLKFAQKALTGQTYEKIEIQALCADNLPFDAELSLKLIKGDGLVCAIRDITERKQRERDLQYHASLQRVVSDAVIVTDMDMRIQSWNEAAERVYGWTEQEVLNRTTSGILLTQFPSPEQGEQSRRQLIEQGWWQGEVIQFHKTGTLLHILGSAALMKDEQGVPFGVVAVNHDISKLRFQERQLRYHASLQQNVNDAVIVTDVEFNIQSWNKAAERIYGWTEQEVLNKSTRDVLRTSYTNDDTHETRKQILREQGWWRGETIQYRKDGSPRHILSSVAVVKDDNGNPYGAVAINHDITERKKIDEALLKSAAEIHDLYNNAPCGYHSVDKNGVIVQINDTELAWFGYSREEVLGKRKIFEFMTPESQEKFHQYFPVFIKQGWMNDLEFEFIRKNGDIFTIIMNKTAIYDDNGQFLHSRSTLFDITERKRIERELGHSEEKYGHLVQTMRGGLAMNDVDDRFTYVNDRMCELIGYSREELLGTYPADYMDEKNIQKLQTQLKQRQASISSSYELVINHKDGHPIHLLVSASPLFGKNKEYEGSVSVVTDITVQKQTEAALRQSETKFRMLVEAAPVSIVISDAQGRITLINEQAEQMFGYQGVELIGKSVDVLVPHDIRHIHQNHRVNYLSNPSIRPMHSGLILQGQRKDKSTFPAEIELSYIETATDILIMAFIVDITERRESEVALQLALDKEKELSELKSRFVSMASHEFRTPLATILAVTETLSAYRHRLDDDQIEHRFERIKEQVEHLKAIMEDVLMLARMQARRVEFNPVRQDLDALCRSVIDEFESRADIGHHIEYFCNAALQDVHLDKKLMRQIISNLVSNAVKYSPPDKPVMVSLDHKNDMIELIVRDQGIGIPEADLAHLFEPFHRAANVGTIQGTGLGLVIIKESVELHGGTIAVESEIDKGTTFSIHIPLNPIGASKNDKNFAN